jgi:hypothetical protein
MKTVLRVVVFVVFFLTGVTALAGSTQKVVVTEAEISGAMGYWVRPTGPYLMYNITVDFRMDPAPGVMRINTNIRKYGDTKWHVARVVVAPVVSGGKVTWNIVETTFDRKPVTNPELATLGQDLAGYGTWYLNDKFSGKVVKSAVPTETKITYQIAN